MFKFLKNNNDLSIEIKKLQSKAYKWMQIEYADNHPQYHGDMTQFVENCVHGFDDEDHDEWLDDPDHWIWEMALDFFPES